MFGVGHRLRIPAGVVATLHGAGAVVLIVQIPSRRASASLAACGHAESLSRDGAIQVTFRIRLLAAPG